MGLLAFLWKAVVWTAERILAVATLVLRCLRKRVMSRRGGGNNPGAIVPVVPGDLVGHFVFVLCAGEWDEAFVCSAIPGCEEWVAMTSNEEGDAYVWVIV